MNIYDGTIVIPEYVQCQVIDGEAIVLNIQTGQFFGLDDVGTRIWELLEDNMPFNRIIATLLDEYEVSEDYLLTETKRFFDELDSCGLIQSKDEI